MSRALLVHSRFQKDILAAKGIPPDSVSVFPVPVNSTVAKPAIPWNGNGYLNLASTGFISDSFDYELLFNTLDLCDLPWKFTWIGGVRRPEDHGLLEKLRREIDRRNWRDRFLITGTIPLEKRDELLSLTHIYCAFFKYKSSSESLATAIGARTLIVSTPIPLIREMTAQFPIMSLVPLDPALAAKAIEQLATDFKMQNDLRKALADYCHEYDRQRMARRLVSFYEKESGL
jgi:glycosyltransferase involved in cell wall biosynthesis